MRIITYYKILISVAASALGISDVQNVSWDGNNLIFQHTDVETPNNPINNITRVRKKYTIKPWVNIKAQFFNSVPDAKFMRMSIDFDDPQTTIFVRLNLEE